MTDSPGIVCNLKCVISLPNGFTPLPDTSNTDRQGMPCEQKCTQALECMTRSIRQSLGMTTVTVRISRLSEAPPTQTLLYQLLGVLLLDEALESTFLIGAALALIGLVIVNSAGNRR